MADDETRQNVEGAGRQRFSGREIAETLEAIRTAKRVKGYLEARVADAVAGTLRPDQTEQVWDSTVADAPSVNAEALSPQDVEVAYNSITQLEGRLRFPGRPEQEADELLIARDNLWNEKFTDKPTPIVKNAMLRRQEGQEQVTYPIDWHGAPVGIGLTPEAQARIDRAPDQPLYGADYQVYKVGDEWFVTGKDDEGAVKIEVGGVRLGKKTPEHVQLARTTARLQDLPAEDGISREAVRLMPGPDGKLIISDRSTNGTVVSESYFGHPPRDSDPQAKTVFLDTAPGSADVRGQSNDTTRAKTARDKIRKLFKG